jgi:hypothetical protein
MITMIDRNSTARAAALQPHGGPAIESQNWAIAALRLPGAGRLQDQKVIDELRCGGDRTSTAPS